MYESNEKIRSIIDRVDRGHSIIPFIEDGLPIDSLYEGRPLVWWLMKSGSFLRSMQDPDYSVMLKDFNYLHAHGAVDVNYQDPDTGNSLLHMAMTGDMVRRLVELGAIISVVNKKGVPIHNNETISKGKNNKISALIDLGIDVSYLRLNHLSALSDLRIVKKLITPETTQEKIVEAFYRTLRFPELHDTAIYLWETYPFLKSSKCRNRTALQFCLENLSIPVENSLTAYRAHKENGFVRLDEKIKQDPYFILAEYFYQNGGFSKESLPLYQVKPYFGHLSYDTPLLYLKTTVNELELRVVDLLAHYEASAFELPTEFYRKLIRRLNSSPYCETKPIMDYDPKYEMLVRVGSAKSHDPDDVWELVIKDKTRGLELKPPREYMKKYGFWKEKVQDRNMSLCLTKLAEKLGHACLCSKNRDALEFSGNHSSILFLANELGEKFSTTMTQSANNEKVWRLTINPNMVEDVKVVLEALCKQKELCSQSEIPALRL